MGATKDFEMSPFEAARKLLSLEAQHLSLGQQSDLIFQDMDLVPLLIQENYLNHRPIISQSDASRLQVSCPMSSLMGCVGRLTNVQHWHLSIAYNVTMQDNTWQVSVQFSSNLIQVRPPRVMESFCLIRAYGLCLLFHMIAILCKAGQLRPDGQEASQRCASQACGHQLDAFSIPWNDTPQTVTSYTKLYNACYHAHSPSVYQWVYR